jgi:hypothetical protein
MAKKETTIIKGYIPHAIHKKKGLVYFSTKRQKWIQYLEDLKIGDILTTPTVPIVNPKKTLKNIVNVGDKKDITVAKIKITIEL